MERILIVDDEPELLDALAEALGKQFDIATAKNGVEAATMLVTIDRLAVVLTDLDMPGMNGADLLDIVRKTRPDVFRALMSGRISDPGFDKGILMAPDPHLLIPKPILNIPKLRTDLKGLPRP